MTEGSSIVGWSVQMEGETIIHNSYIPATYNIIETARKIWYSKYHTMPLQIIKLTPNFV